MSFYNLQFSYWGSLAFEPSCNIVGGESSNFAGCLSLHLWIHRIFRYPK